MGLRGRAHSGHSRASLAKHRYVRRPACLSGVQDSVDATGSGPGQFRLGPGLHRLDNARRHRALARPDPVLRLVSELQIPECRCNAVALGNHAPLPLGPAYRTLAAQPSHARRRDDGCVIVGRFAADPTRRAHQSVDTGVPERIQFRRCRQPPHGLGRGRVSAADQAVRPALPRQLRVQHAQGRSAGNRLSSRRVLGTEHPGRGTARIHAYHAVHLLPPRSFHHVRELPDNYGPSARSGRGPTFRHREYHPERLAEGRYRGRLHSSRLPQPGRLPAQELQGPRGHNLPAPTQRVPNPRLGHTVGRRD